MNTTITKDGKAWGELKIFLSQENKSQQLPTYLENIQVVNLGSFRLAFFFSDNNHAHTYDLRFI